MKNDMKNPFMLISYNEVQPSWLEHVIIVKWAGLGDIIGGRANAHELVVMHM